MPDVATHAAAKNAILTTSVNVRFLEESLIRQPMCGDSGE